MEMRRNYTTAARRVRRDGSGVQERDEARKAYRKTLLKRKKEYWDDFLAKAKKNDVWMVHQFTKVRVPNRVPGGRSNSPEATEQTIMTHFFPPADDPAGMLPAKRHDLGVSDELAMIDEVSVALSKCSKKSAAGPNQVPYGVSKGIMLVNQKIIPALINDMLVWGIHPPMLKESIGVILPKPNKNDYTDCSSFRVIALMQTFSKIAERVVNNRLMKIVYESGLYCINQTGSLPHRSTVDAAISL